MSFYVNLPFSSPRKVSKVSLFYPSSYFTMVLSTEVGSQLGLTKCKQKQRARFVNSVDSVVDLDSVWISFQCLQNIRIFRNVKRLVK